MSSYKKYAVIYIIIVICIIAAYTIWALIRKKRNVDINKNKNINGRGRNKLYFLYRFYQAIPGLRKLFQNVMKNTEAVYPTDQMSINREATKIMTKSLGMSVLAMAAMTFMSKGDMWYIMMGILVASIMFHMSITKTFRKKETQLLEQLKFFLSRVRTHYNQSFIVEDAVEDTLDEIPYEVGLHIFRIHEIITSPIMHEKIEEYKSTSPNRFFLLLLSICSTSKEYNSGDRSFTDSLTRLEEEINEELLKRQYTEERFKFTSEMTLTSVFLIKPLETFVRNRVPDLTEFFDKNGNTLLISIFILIMITYFLIEALKENTRGEIVQTNIWSKIAGLPYISSFLNRLINKKYVKMIKINEDMKQIGDHTGPKALYAKRLVYALVAFIVFNSSVFVTTLTTKMTMLTNYVCEIDSTIVPNNNYRKSMQAATENYIIAYKDVDMKNISKEEMIEHIMNDTSIRNAEYAEIVADEVIQELEEYHNTYFKWYMLLVAAAISVVAFYVPYVFLKFKVKLASMNQKEEISQFQTLMLVLMNADGITLDEILEWLSCFAYCFKPTIDECIVNLEMKGQKALEDMKMSENNQEFQCFVDSLMEIDNTDVKTAFSTIEVEREYSLKDREEKNHSIADQRSTYARILVFVALIAMFLEYYVFPVGEMASRMFDMLPG